MNCRSCVCEIPKDAVAPDKYYCANQCSQCPPRDDLDRLSVEFEATMKEGIEMAHGDLALAYAIAVTNWVLSLDDRDRLEAELKTALDEVELLKGRMN